MLMALIYVLIICVVGAVLFWVIEKFVSDGRLVNLLKNPSGSDLPLSNFATGAPFAWSKGATLAIITAVQLGARDEPAACRATP